LIFGLSLVIVLQSYASSNRMLIVIDYQNDFLQGGALGAENDNEEKKENQNKVTKNIIEMIGKFNAKNFAIVTSQDKHPKDHVSFLSAHQKTNDDIKINPGQIPQVCLTYREFGEPYEILDYNYSPYDDNNKSICVDENQMIQEMWPDHCVDGTNGFEIESSVQEALKKENLDKSTDTFNVFKGTDQNVDAYSVIKNNVGVIYSEVLEYIQEKEISQVYLVGVATDFCVFNTAKDLVEESNDKYEVIIVHDACIEIMQGEGEKKVQDFNRPRNDVETIKWKTFKKVEEEIDASSQFDLLI